MTFQTPLISLRESTFSPFPTTQILLVALLCNSLYVVYTVLFFFPQMIIEFIFILPSSPQLEQLSEYDREFG